MKTNKPVAVLALMLAVGCAHSRTQPGMDGVQSAVVSPCTGTIVMEYRSQGVQNLLAIAPDSVTAKPLTTGSVYDFGPTCSPTKPLIVFARKTTDHKAALWTVAMDGSKLNRITSGQTRDWMPRFTPDGEEVIYCSATGDDTSLYAIGENGTNRRPVAIAYRSSIRPQPLNDDGQILFWRAWNRAKGGSFEEPAWDYHGPYLLDPVTDLCTRLHEDFYARPISVSASLRLGIVAVCVPDDSNDDALLLYWREEPARWRYLRPSSEGYVDLDEYKKNTIDLRYPCFSPEGAMLVFTRVERGKNQSTLHVMDMNTGTARQVYGQGNWIESPCFLLGEEKIIFIAVEMEGGQACRQLWMVDTDGTNAKRLDAGIGTTASESMATPPRKPGRVAGPKVVVLRQ
ncbi:MAG: hypothetical protein AMXMBFR84_22450 [Candidatus Hydrogenedentota bacterium]